MRLREATLGDAHAIAEVNCAAALVGYGDIFPPEAPKPTPDSLVPVWVELLEEPFGTVLVAEPDAGVMTPGAVGVVGSVCVLRDESVPSGWLLAGLYVQPSGWGRGIGGQLHDAALATARDEGARDMNLWVLVGNSRARAVYEHWGWRFVPGCELPHDVPGIIEVLYQRRM